MCGVAGIAAFPDGDRPTAEQIQRMCATLVHRGPDEDGFDLDGGVGLGMRRLSIIDVDGGRQPLRNEDDSVRMVFNGEIYNFPEVRARLESSGHRFRTNSDGEVVVHLWEEHGEDFASHLNGMFSIALHDLRRRRLVLARDRLGVKPLFYYRTGRHLVFGSEIKALLASGLVPRDLDLDALGQFLSWEYVPGPATMFAEIRKLEAGALLTADLETGRIEQSRWWTLPSPEEQHPLQQPDWDDRVDEQLRTAVHRCLISDVPLGGFLSGGVDSSLVVSAMREAGETRTFSIGFDDSTYNESAWARKVADHLGVSHRVEVLEPHAADLFDHLMQFMDDPIGDFSIFPTYLLSKLAREEVTVALSGDGGDELFGGYETYVAQEKSRAWRRLPSVLRHGIAEPLIRSLRPARAKKGLVNKAKRFVEGFEHDERLAHARWRLFVGRAMRSELFLPAAARSLEAPIEQHILELADEAGDRSELDRGLYVDLRSYLVDNCLVKVDRMSMACSLEVRVPFLDHEVVELAFRLPQELKLDRGSTKVLLKRVAARHVPRDCVYRPKEGFSMPIKQWLGTELRPLMEELLSARTIAQDAIFHSATIERLKREHLENRANHSHILWSLMVFQDWKRRWSVG